MSEAGKTEMKRPPLGTSAKKQSWVMRHKLLTLASLFVLAGLVHYLVTRPVDNPQPQKKQIVQGVFPYDKGWELRIEASYYSNNPTCKQTARAFFIFPQAEVSREAWRTIPVVREEGNRYRFEFYEDAIDPGFCDWRLQFVYYRIFSNGAKIQGGAILRFPSSYNVIRYDCVNVKSTYYKAPDRTPVEQVGVACLERDNHWKDSARTDNQIDFVWKENKQ
jgi:hypothetical protein